MEKVEDLLSQPQPEGKPWDFMPSQWGRFSLLELERRAPESKLAQWELLHRVHDGNAAALRGILKVLKAHPFLKEQLLPQLQKVDLTGIKALAGKGDKSSYKALRKLAKFRPDLDQFIQERADTHPVRPGDKI